MPPDQPPRQPLPEAPVAPVRPHRFEVHGQTIEDPYAWLKAENWRDVLKDPAQLAPEIRTHLDAENAYTQAVLAGMEDLRERLVKEMRGRIKEDDASVPQPDGPFAYYTRFREGGQHPLICPPRAREATTRSSSTATGRRRAIPSSISATRAIRPTTA
jgi:oligopeptidase B